MFNPSIQHFQSWGTALGNLPERCLQTAFWLGKQVVEFPATATAVGKTTFDTTVRCGKVAHAIYKTPLCQYPKYITQSGYVAWCLLRDKNYTDMSTYIADRIPEIAGGVRQGLIGLDWCAEKVIRASIVPLNLLNASDAAACISGASRLTYSVLDRLHTLTPFERLGLINSVAVALVSGIRMYVHSDHNPLEVCTPADFPLWYLECASGGISASYYTWVAYKNQENFRNGVYKQITECKQLLDVFNFPGPGALEAETLA